MERMHAVFVFGLVVAATVGCEPTVPIPVTQGGLCTDVGSLVPSEDDCNTCTCEANHTWRCTQNLCECIPGTSKPANDGCNVCSCTTSGQWVCTLRACVVDTCAEGRNSYDSYRERLLSTGGGTSCQTDADCSMIYENNRCVANCGIAVPVNLATAIAQRLETNGNQFCASCPPVLIPPCLPLEARCMEGVCSSGPIEPR